MSRIAQIPRAARFGMLRGFNGNDIIVLIDRTQTSEPLLAEYIDFLELVYDVRIRIKNKICGTWLIIPAPHRSEAGIRVASWLYRIEFQILGPR